MRFPRLIELFRNPKTRDWAIGVAVLLQLAAAGVAVASPIAGVALGLVVITLLTGVLVDFSADTDAAAPQVREELVAAIAERVGDDMEKRDLKLLDQLDRRPGVIPGVSAVYNDPGEMPLQRLIARSDELVLVGWYFTVLEDGDPYRALVKFFSKNGRLTILVPDVAAADLLESLAQLRDPSKAQIDGERLAGYACSSVTRLDKAREQGGGKEEALRVCAVSVAIPYAAYCFSGQDLIIGPYEIAFEPSCRAPRLHFDLDTAPHCKAFWDNEIEQLTTTYPPASAADFLARRP